MDTTRGNMFRSVLKAIYVICHEKKHHPGYMHDNQTMDIICNCMYMCNTFCIIRTHIRSHTHMCIKCIYTYEITQLCAHIDCIDVSVMTGLLSVGFLTSRRFATTWHEFPKPNDTLRYIARRFGSFGSRES